MPKKQTTKKKKTDQPPWDEPLVWGLTPREIFDVVGTKSSATTDRRSLIDETWIYPAAPRMDAINKRTGHSCKLREEEYEEADGEVTVSRMVELKIGDCFLHFWWDTPSRSDDVEHEWVRKESERVFRLLSRMIGVPVSRKTVVGARD